MHNILIGKRNLQWKSWLLTCNLPSPEVVLKSCWDLFAVNVVNSFTEISTKQCEDLHCPMPYKTAAVCIKFQETEATRMKGSAPPRETAGGSTFEGGKKKYLYIEIKISQYSVVEDSSINTDRLSKPGEQNVNLPFISLCNS